MFQLFGAFTVNANVAIEGTAKIDLKESIRYRTVRHGRWSSVRGNLNKSQTEFQDNFTLNKDLFHTGFMEALEINMNPFSSHSVGIMNHIFYVRDVDVELMSRNELLIIS